MLKDGKLKNVECRIENTTFCNTHCSICPREKMTRPKCTMSHRDFIALVDQAKELGAEIISIFGYGEPLMDKNIHKKIQYCTDQGLKTFLSTNAGAMNAAASTRLLRAGLTQVRFSVHGLERTYKKVHNMNWSRTIENIDTFIRFNNNGFDKQAKVIVSVIPMSAEPLADIVQFWDREGVELEIWRPHNWAGTKKYRSGERRKKVCGRPFNGPLQINADGKVMVCCFDYDAKMTIGDLSNTTIKEIIEGDKLDHIQAAHLCSDLGGLPCESCDQLYDYKISPLLYSTIDPDCGYDKTSTIKADVNA